MDERVDLMSFTKRKPIVFLSLVTVSCLGCSTWKVDRNADTDSSFDSNGNTDSDIDADADTDADTDADADADADVDVDVDADTDTGTDTDSGSESTTEPLQPNDTETPSDTQTEGGTDSAFDTGTEKDISTESETESGSDPDGGADSEEVCAEQDFAIDWVPVKLMIAVDFSGSMVNPESKYDIARESIEKMLTDFAGRFLFGFDTYPDRVEVSGCAVDDPIWFDCAQGNEFEIIDWLNHNTPTKGSGDPLLLEMGKFLNDPDYAPGFTADTAQGNAYLVIVADGDDCCGPDGVYNFASSWQTELAAMSLALNQKGIKTIAVGYTENADPDALNAIAANGGTEFTSYIPAADQAALDNALTTIAGSIVSCSFEISDPGSSSDPNKVNFYFDTEVIPYDQGCIAGEGWMWEGDDHTHMVLCDESCKRLESGEVSSVSAKFGCPVVIVV